MVHFSNLKWIEKRCKSILLPHIKWLLWGREAQPKTLGPRPYIRTTIARRDEKAQLEDLRKEHLVKGTSMIRGCVQRSEESNTLGSEEP